jgi:hypothetical protein
MKLRIAVLCALAQGVAGTRGAVGIQIQNVDLRFTRDVVLGVRALRGELERTKPAVPVTFDDSNSFVVDVDSAEIHISMESLTGLMNEYVFGYDGAPIKNISVKVENGRLVQTGTLKKGVELPFRVEGSLSVTADGRVRVHAEKIKVEHLPVTTLLHLLGENLEKLIRENPGRGVEVEGDDLILSPSSLTPPPHMRGRVTRVNVADNSIVMIFNSGRHRNVLKPPYHTAAYIYHRGGILRFGKLTMNDADLEIVGDRPGRFEFFQKEYKKQLVAGYSKNTAGNGLVAHMADYSHFEASADKSR